MLTIDEDTFCQRWDAELAVIKKKTGLDLNSLCPSVELKADSELFPNRNDPGFILIRQGYVKICHVEDGEDHAIRIANPGAIIGYGSWYLESPEHFKVKAITKTQASYYKKQIFDQFLDLSKNLNALVSESLVRTIMIKQYRIAALEQTSSKQRVVALILSLAHKLGKKTDDGILISVDVGRQTMAQLSGTTQVNLSRVLTDLEEKKIIVRVRRSILIPDLAKLKASVK